MIRIRKPVRKSSLIMKSAVVGFSSSLQTLNPNCGGLIIEFGP